MPPAMLWCVIYPLLARLRSETCRLLAPIKTEVCAYLKSLGLFQALKEQGIEVNDRDTPERPDTPLVLPLTRFDNESEVDRLTNQAYDALQSAGFGSANLYPVVSETFAELAMNAVQHSESPIGAYGFLQFYESELGRTFICGVADGGIGIKQSLWKNPALRDQIPYDWAAIELALEERVSGTLDQRRGIGLYGVVQDMRKAGRQLIIHSGVGFLQMSEELERQTRRTRLFPGTLAYVSIPT